MPRYEDGNNPDSRRQPAKLGKKEKAQAGKHTYPLGARMKKGAKLDCLACNPRKPNPKCKGCQGNGYIIV
jgi:hypothetical protein